MANLQPGHSIRSIIKVLLYLMVGERSVLPSEDQMIEMRDPLLHNPSQRYSAQQLLCKTVYPQQICDSGVVLDQAPVCVCVPTGGHYIVVFSSIVCVDQCLQQTCSNPLSVCCLKLRAYYVTPLIQHRIKTDSKRPQPRLPPHTLTSDLEDLFV